MSVTPTKISPLFSNHFSVENGRDVKHRNQNGIKSNKACQTVTDKTNFHKRQQHTSHLHRWSPQFVVPKFACHLSMHTYSLEARSNQGQSPLKTAWSLAQSKASWPREFSRRHESLNAAQCVKWTERSLTWRLQDLLISKSFGDGTWCRRGKVPQSVSPHLSYL